MALEGEWKYQSYRPDPGSVPADPAVSQTFVPWSPPGLGRVTIDKGDATGILEFMGTKITLDLKIQVTDGDPARLFISASMRGKTFTNELQGWLVPASLTLGGKVDDNTPLVVRGSIVQTSEDINTDNPQPIYTTGFFVLEPL